MMHWTSPYKDPPPPFRPHPLSDLELLVATTSGYSAMCKEKIFLILIQNVIIIKGNFWLLLVDDLEEQIFLWAPLLL